MVATDQIKVRATMSQADLDRIEELGELLKINRASAIGTAVGLALPLVREIRRGGEVIVREKNGATRKLLLHA